MKLRNLLALALVPALLLTGCWSAEEPAEGNAGILSPSELEEPEEAPKAALPERFTLPYLPDQTLDPVTCADGMQQNVGALLYEGLFRLDESFTPQPCLCAASAYDDASLTWTFTLRPGVMFTDGSPLTAADVVATLNRARTSQRYAARFTTILSYSGEGDTVTVRLNRGNALLPALLDIPIVKAGTQDETVPLGTGPYLWAWDAGAPSLRANAAWWGGAKQPADQIGLSAAKDADTLLYQFTSHEVQLITADLTGTSPVSTTGNIAFTDADTTVLQYVGINTRTPLLQEARVRRALALGLDRVYAVSAFLSGHALPAQFPLSPASPLYPASLERVYSHESFTSALINAGLSGASSQTLTLLVNEENSFKVSMARFVASSLTAGDLSVQVEALPWEEFQAALRRGDYDLYYGETRLTADFDLRRLVGTGGSLNYGGYSDAATDMLLSVFAASGAAEDAERLCRHLQEQVPLLPVCFKSTSVLVQEDVVEGLSPTASDPFYGMEHWTLRLAEE